MRSLYNPLLEDFSVEFDKYGDNPRTLTIKAGDVKKFKNWEARHLETHLVERMLNENPPENKNRDAKREELLKIIRVCKA
jgi:hypothetical protein